MDETNVDFLTCTAQPSSVGSIYVSEKCMETRKISVCCAVHEMEKGCQNTSAKFRFQNVPWSSEDRNYKKTTFQFPSERLNPLSAIDLI